MKKVTSKDGTTIAFDQVGKGPAVILVSGATGYRSHPMFTQLAELLSEHFTVFNYDRRGRGDSGDTKPYAVQREVEDIAAVIDAAGGSAFVYGISSGAVLALEAASKLPAQVNKLALYEPPFILDASRPPLPNDYVQQLNAAIAAGKRGAAVEIFMTKALGIPADYLAPMRADPSWAETEAVAHTIAYDGLIMGDTMRGKPLPSERVQQWAHATMPVLVLAGEKSEGYFHDGAQALVDVLPNAQRRMLAGQDHGVAPEALAPVLTEFFAGSAGGKDSTTTGKQAVKSGYASVNGLKMYYQIHGAEKSGQPQLVLLHGGVGAIEMFGQVLPMLAQGRQVIAVDLQAHGRTADIDRPLRFELMADDVAALIEHLGFKQADVMGYSLGGGVALQTALRHPDVVRKLVLVSTPFKRQGWYPELLVGQAQMGPAAAEPMKQTPMYQLYASVAPKPEDWSVLLTKLGELLRRDYDWSKAVAAMEVPTLLVVGDADGVRTAHAVAFFELLGGGKRDAGFDGSGMSIARLAILPGLTHYDIFSSPTLASTITPFLDAPMPEAK